MPQLLVAIACISRGESMAELTSENDALIRVFSNFTLVFFISFFQ